MEEDKQWVVVLKLQRVPTWRLVHKFLVLRVRLSILASIDFIGIFINLYINIIKNKTLKSRRKYFKTFLFLDLYRSNIFKLYKIFNIFNKILKNIFLCIYYQQNKREIYLLLLQRCPESAIFHWPRRSRRGSSRARFPCATTDRRADRARWFLNCERAGQFQRGSGDQACTRVSAAWSARHGV